MCGHVYAMACMLRSEVSWSQFSPIMWIPGLKLRLAGSSVGNFIFCAFSLAS